MRILLTTVFLCLTMTKAHSYDCKIDGIYYNLHGDGVEVTYGRKYMNSYKMKYVEIPSQINYKGKAYTVTSIGNAAFCECSQIVSVKLPESIERIGRFAFYYCESLKEITIPNKIIDIGECAFCGCENIKSFIIPDSLKIIKRDAFRYCYNLTVISLPKDLYKIEEHAFFSTGINEVVLPQGLKVIEEGAFCGCDITSITLPASLDSIIGYPFDNPKYVKSFIKNPDVVYKSNHHVYLEPILTYPNSTLYVPKGTREKYLVLEPWKTYREIIEMEE